MSHGDGEEPLGPVVKLTYAILLAALNKRAQRIRIHGRGETGEGEILLMIEGRRERPRFAVQVSGHGHDLTATLDALEGYDP